MLFLAERFDLVSLLDASSPPPPLPPTTVLGFLGAGSIEKSPPELGLVSGAAEEEVVEVSSESLSSLLPYATKDMIADVTIKYYSSAVTRGHG